MTTEQEGAPSATAGGASAPDPISKAVAGAFTEALSGVAEAWKQIIAANPGLAYLAEPVTAEILPADRRSPDGDRFMELLIASDFLDEDDVMSVLAVFEDLTKESGQDPRDAEIERLRTALARYQKRMGDDLLCGGKLVERVRAALRIDNGSTCIRASMDGVVGDVGRLCDEIERLRKEYDEVLVSGVLRETLDAEIERLRGEVYSNNVAMGGFVTRIATALGGKSFGDAQELVDDVQRLVRDCADNAEEWKRADAEVTRLRAQVDELAGIRVALFGKVRQALSERDDYAGRLRDTDAAYAKVTAERDSLRAERDDLRVRLKTIAQLAGRLAQRGAPAEPRRWVAGDAEPEIGTTVRRADGDLTNTRRKDGTWHVNTCPYPADECEHGTRTWEWLTKEPLVEAVDSDD